MPRLDLSNIPTSLPPLVWEGATEQQLAVCDWVSNRVGNLNLIAVAGSGKSTTLRKACRLMSGKVAIAAFNKKIAVEFSTKLQQDGVGPNVQSKTFHAYGLGAWKKLAGSAQVDEYKSDNIMEKLGVDDKLQKTVKQLVSLAKNHAFGVDGSIHDAPWSQLIDHFDLAYSLDDDDDQDEWEEAIIQLSIATLEESIKQSNKIIDFDDMLYAPLQAGAVFEKNDWVLVDEAQDTNPTRRMMAARMLKQGGRAIFVGDPRQAIYGFTGASADAMDVIAGEFNCIELPLTFSWRCPKAVVRHAQQWVSHIQAPESAPEGSVLSFSEDEFRQLIMPRLQPQDAILCRNTAPIIQLALELIRKRIACHVEGREIGKGLIAMTKRWKVYGAREMLDRLEDWSRKEQSKLRAKKQDRKAEAVADKVATIRVLVGDLKAGASLNDLHRSIDQLFGDTPEGQPSPNVTLSTIHKAKGREWKTVYLWGRNAFMPSKYAKEGWQLEQEENLIYVAVTRAMDRLVEIDVVAV